MRWALALLVTVLLAPQAAAVQLVVPQAADGAPILAGREHDFAAVAENETERNATRVVLRQCVGHPGAIRFCYPDVNMTKGPDGAWTATRRIDGALEGEKLGSNVTMHVPNGTRTYAPEGEEYLFQTIGFGAPTPMPLAWVAGAFAFAALRRRAR